MQDFEKRVYDGNRKLLDLLLNHTCEETVDYVMDRISNIFEINNKFERGKTFLHYSIQRGSKEIVEALIDSGANIDALDENKQSPIYETVILGQFDIFKLLIEKGADIYASDFEKRTVLHFASICSKPTILL